MYKNGFGAQVGSVIFSCVLAAPSPGQVSQGPIAVKAIAEVESRNTESGHEVTRLLPASRVVSGDHVSYTLEARNVSGAVLEAPVITNPIPAHMVYVADSAVGPGTEVSYSVDGGRSFEKPDTLKISMPDGSARAAVAADYTHIRWQLRTRLKANSIAFVRFRALVK